MANRKPLFTANPEHLAKLKEGVKLWNKWRDENPDVWPNLDMANLSGDDLIRANLSKASLIGANLSEANLIEVNLSGTYLFGADLSEANLCEANLSGASLSDADLSGAYLAGADLSKANLIKANLSGARLRGADLIGANLHEASLIGADLSRVDLGGADLSEADLSEANLMEAKLHETKIKYAKLQGASFRRVEVDGSTIIWGCSIDRYRGDEEDDPSLQSTDFEGVGLGNIRIDKPGRQLLEYNVRRANWNRWYQGKKPWFMPPLKGWQKRRRLAWTWPVRWFWALSDYGASTKRIIIWFFALSLVFAAVYASLAYCAPPGAVHDLVVEKHDPLWHYGLLVIVRPIYFSVVTMTTLGFGDMHAEKGSILGHVLLTLQVILGYVMLGALVTRFAVMFTGGGPAGKFAPTPKQPQMYPLSQIMGYFWL